jgi:RNA polymerase sigma-70 factor (ECF subfamily)
VDFARHLAARVPAGIAPLEWLAEAHAGDLYLACACEKGDGTAIEALETLFAPALRPVLARLESAADREEIVQQLREKLLVRNDGKPPRIAGYAGRGPLSHWLKVAAIREALEVDRRKHRAFVPDEEALARAPAMDPDPDTAYLRSHFRPQFDQALKTAMGMLSARERTLLRMHHVHSVGVEQLGAMYRVHPSTASRWMARARARILTETRRLVRQSLRLSPSSWRSLLRVVRSELHVSIERALATDESTSDAYPPLQKNVRRPSSR